MFFVVIIDMRDVNGKVLALTKDQDIAHFPTEASARNAAEKNNLCLAYGFHIAPIGAHSHEAQSRRE
jgi:hypothetical protein